MKPLLIKSDVYDVALSHEAQTVGKNGLIIPSPIFRVLSSGVTSCITFYEASQAAVICLSALVNKMTFSQVIQASTICVFHSNVDVASPIEFALMCNKAGDPGVERRAIVRVSSTFSS
jgi:hypothetical protein